MATFAKTAENELLRLKVQFRWNLAAQKVAQWSGALWL